MVPWCIFEGKELNLKAKLAILITSRGRSFWDISIFYYNTEVLSLWPREEKWSLEMATHSSTLAWKIPWMEKPGRLQSMGSLRVGHNWATSLSLFTFMHWRRKWQPTPLFLPGESQGWGSLVGCHLWGRRVGHNWSDLAAVAAVHYDRCPVKRKVSCDQRDRGGVIQLQTKPHGLPPTTRS